MTHHDRSRLCRKMEAWIRKHGTIHSTQKNYIKFHEDEIQNWIRN
jgi:hypothetical protein